MKTCAALVLAALLLAIGCGGGASSAEKSPESLDTITKLVDGWAFFQRLTGVQGLTGRGFAYKDDPAEDSMFSGPFYPDEQPTRTKVSTKRGQTRSAKKEVKTMDPKLFQEVPLNTFGPNPCSPPEQEPSWRGVTINAPTKVSFQRGKRIGLSKTFAAIPICGLYRLDVPFPLVEDVIQLFALDKRSGELYSGRVVELDPSPEIPPPPSPPLTAEDVKGLASGRYFNPNLADFAGLPEGPGNYDVWVEVRGVRSNTVKLEVVQGSLR